MSQLPHLRRAIAVFGAALALLLSLPMAAGSQELQDPSDVQEDVGGPRQIVEEPLPGILVNQEPGFQTLRAGDRPGFVVSVANTGQAPLLDVAVSSAATPACNRDASDLAALALIAPGARVTYECTDVVRFADYTNRVVATGSNRSGATASDWAESVVDVVTPSIAVLKDTLGGIISSGDTATFALSVRNDGEMDLIGVEVDDPLVPACNRTFTHLPIGTQESWTCILPNVTEGLTNVVTASGQPSIRKEPIGDRVTAGDNADIRVPGISIDKNTLTPVVRAGTPSTFEISVENTGSIALVGTTVSDPAVAACDRDLGTVGVGEIVTYTCSLDATLDDLTNIATVTATAADGGPAVSDSDASDVAVIDPSIHIIKTTGDTLLRDRGNVTFTIAVTNNGDSPLTGVTVADELSPTCDRVIGDLDPTDSVTYTCVVNDVTESLLNTAVAVGVPLAGDPVTDSDSAAVEVIHPAVDILKTVEDATVEPGDDAVFTIVVTNSGDDALSDVTVTDAATPGCDTDLGTLAAGESATFGCVAADVAADFTNVADVTGTPRVGDDVSASDSVFVDRVDPSITLTKDAASNAIADGDNATFTLTATNSGDTPLTDVRIVDSATPNCDREIAVLAIGESQTWTCVTEALVADLLNIANATATTPDGHTVESSDRDTVTVTGVAGTTQTPEPDLAVTGNDPALVAWTSGALIGLGMLLRRRGRRGSTD